ncbi:hypothetical protein LB505_012956 [Fusarium chuoi]|nr:hypothetical protein LB505_012956 [Fusarium chuoi]
MKEPVIGHMGRLVTDDRQVPMFGGSTTGVHFISQAEQQLQLLHMHKDALPSCAYGLYLHNPWGASVHSNHRPMDAIVSYCSQVIDNRCNSRAAELVSKSRL